MRQSISIAILLFCSIALKAQERNFDPFNYSIQKQSISAHGAVVSAHPLASMVGLSILQQGGNAFDAAIATQLALAVVFPGAGNIGGGGFMVAHLAGGKNIAIDYREKAPYLASRDMYLDSLGNAQPRLSLETHLASGIPGSIAGIFAEFKYARLPFQKLIQPAIDLAKNGFAITAAQAASFNANRKDFIKRNSSATAFVKPALWKAGDTLIQPALANTLLRIRENGASEFYQGETAKMMLEEMNRGKGLFSAADLAQYTATERTAMNFKYKKFHVLSMPLPSSGGILLQQMLGMIEPYHLGDMGFQSAAAVQLMIEVERRAFADRAEFLGDPDFVKVPVSTLVSKSYLKKRMADYTPGKAGNSLVTRAGNVKESEETTHFSVADNEGNAVAITTTLNDSYGSKIVVTGAGFILNNEMDDFSIKPGVPNMYGAIGNEMNAIQAGKRMLSSMTPTILLKKGKPFLIVGSPGGTTIPTSVFQTIVNIGEFGLSASDAVNQAKFHHQWLPDSVFIERDFPATIAEQLKTMGYSIKSRSSIGRTDIILFKKKSFIAVGDKRGDDDAEGY